jgi:transcriptional regulator with XRE-family HTH domain
MNPDAEELETAGPQDEQLSVDYALILDGGPEWHVAFKRFRLALGIGQKTIAKRMGIHPTTITKWEHGRSQPDRETRARALAAIGWTPSSLPPAPAPAHQQAPHTVHVPANRRISKEESLPKGQDWEPRPSQPTVVRRRPYRVSHSESRLLRTLEELIYGGADDAKRR